MKVAISSDSLSQTQMTTLATWTIRPRLIAVPGVANVAILRFAKPISPRPQAPGQEITERGVAQTVA